MLSVMFSIFTGVIMGMQNNTRVISVTENEPMPVPEVPIVNVLTPSNTTAASALPSPKVVEPSIQPPTESFVAECGYNYYNCPDFATHAEAQAVFEECGGVSYDVHRLDADHDGLVCEKYK